MMADRTKLPESSGFVRMLTNKCGLRWPRVGKNRPISTPKFDPEWGRFGPCRAALLHRCGACRHLPGQLSGMRGEHHAPRLSGAALHALPLPSQAPLQLRRPRPRCCAAGISSRGTIARASGAERILRAKARRGCAHLPQTICRVWCRARPRGRALSARGTSSAAWRCPAGTSWAPRPCPGPRRGSRGPRRRRPCRGARPTGRRG